MRHVEIAPGVIEIRLLRANIHAILGRPVTLVDSGLPGSAESIAAALAAHGRSLGDVDRLLCTHGHPDHAGSAAELAAAGVEVCIHPADAVALSTSLRDAVRSPARGRFFAAVTPAPPRTTPLQDGDVLPVLGGLEVIHTPGHTAGSICLWAPVAGLLFVGDLLQRRFGRVTFASSVYSDDVRAARRSVQRLGELDVATIVFGHYPPLGIGAREVLARLVKDAARA